MKNTFFLKDITKSSPKSYFFENESGTYTEAPFHQSSFATPALGIFSTINDLTKWMQCLLEKGSFLLSEKAFLKMISPQIEAKSSFEAPIILSHYGLGCHVGSYKKHLLIAHSGTYDGFQALFLHLPDKKIGLIILTNTAIVENRKLRIDKPFASYVAKRILDDVLEYKEKSSLSYLGSYTHPGYGTITIYEQNGHLKAKYGDISSQLRFLEKDTFIGEEFAFSCKIFRFCNNELQVYMEPAFSISFLKTTAP